MLRGLCLLPCVAAVLLCAASPAQALLFEPVTVDGHRILLVRDCGKQNFKDSGCTAQTSGFASGDAARLRRVMSRDFSEIWLISGGGNLDEGIKVGEVFREYQATVRVPHGYHCVSACTVAFMGGFFRIVDEGATYEVHAASAFLRGFDNGYTSGVLKRLNWDAHAELARAAAEELDDARGWAARLVTYFQLSLLPPGVGVSNSRRLQEWSRTAPASDYPGSARAAADAERFRREGETAAQETLMRIERDSMAQAIAELRMLVPQLGPRAGAALKMLEAMYSSRIIFTASLSRETLEEMGYTTVIINPVGP